MRQYSSQKYSSFLELEAALAGAFGQLFDAAVENIAAAVKYDLGDALFSGAFQRSARRPCVRCFFVSAVTIETPCPTGSSCAQCNSVYIVDDLGVDVLLVERNTFRRGHSAVPLKSCRELSCGGSVWLCSVSALFTICYSLLTYFLTLTGLAFLAADNLASIA